jgi:hypothetical protein
MEKIKYRYRFWYRYRPKFMVSVSVSVSTKKASIAHHYPIVGMFGMRNFRYRYTNSFDNYKGKFFNGNVKEILSNSKRENEAVSNMFRTTHTQCKISLKWKF